MPPRLKFTTQTMRQRLRCATLLGWTRRAEMLEKVISSPPAVDGEFSLLENFPGRASSARESTTLQPAGRS
ncbi:hypothetical protein [Luteolibacter soli]|uniref:hypothetical protein n=1 Tax=Luteolibacter soli TaxID=3135280 RepID=UPI00311A12F4